VKTTSHIGFWIILAIVGIFAVPFFVSGDSLLGSLKREQASLERVFGSGLATDLNVTAISVHGVVFGSTGIQARLNDLQHTQTDMKLAKQVGSEIAVYFANEADGRIRAFSIQLYSVTLRIVVMLAWVVVLLPFFVAVVYDGFMMRHVKFANMGHQNPTAFSLGFHISIILCAFPLLSLVVPTYIVTPLFMPFWALLAALPFSFAIRHTQPILTK
jgi:hypothetical protein